MDVYANCSIITYNINYVLNLGSLTTDKTEYNGLRVLSDCGSIKNISINENNKIYKSIDGNVYSKNGKQFIKYSVGKTENSFTIPDSVTSIGSFAFHGCSLLKNVYFGGTAEDWEKINIDSNNSYLIDATCYYYSETMPEESGNYWHYGPDGVTPVIW